MSDPIRVSIVDNDDASRRGIRAALECAGDIAVVSETGDGREAAALIRQALPDVVLLAVGTSRAGSLQTVGRLRELSPQVKIVVLDDDEQLALEAFRAGALGHLVRGKARPVEIVEAVRAVARGKAVLSPGLAGRILDEIVQERCHRMRPQ